MKNIEIKQLCMRLLRADTENDVIEILKNAGFWDDSDAWRLYGDKEGNFAKLAISKLYQRPRLSKRSSIVAIRD